jgi:hypothetical protein
MAVRTSTGNYSPSALIPWASTVNVGQTEERSITVLGILTGVTSTASRTTSTTFDSTEAALWVYQGQANIQSWAASSLVIAGFLISSNGQIWRSLSNRVTGLTLDASELTNWVAEPTYRNGGQIVLSNFAANGSIGTAATTVDVVTSYLFNQTTAGITLTLPTPTFSGLSKVVRLINVPIAGAVPFTVGPATLGVGETRWALWNTVAWTLMISTASPSSSDISLSMA